MGFFKSLIKATVPNEIIKFADKAVPNEVKAAIPNEVKPVIDPIGVGGLNPNPSLANTLDPLNLSGNRTDTGSSPSSRLAVGVGGAPPTYDKTTLDIFNAQLALQDPLLQANKLLQPQWIDLGNEMTARSAKAQMALMADLYKQSGTIEAAYQNQLRGNELQQLQTTLPQYQQAFNALTPGYSQALSSTGQLAQQSMARSLQTPQLTAFENQVSSPYAVPMPAQQQAATRHSSWRLCCRRAAVQSCRHFKNCRHTTKCRIFKHSWQCPTDSCSGW
jgi:hypothetical protein